MRHPDRIVSEPRRLTGGRGCAVLRWSRLRRRYREQNVLLSDLRGVESPWPIRSTSVRAPERGFRTIK